MSENIDWSAFFADMDLIWQRPPLRWEEGPFVGGGLVGALAYVNADANAFRFFLGRSDVGKLDYPCKCSDPNRIQIGALELLLEDAIRGDRFRARMDLWNAEVRGVLATEGGDVEFRALAPSGGSSVVVDLKGDVSWEWRPEFIPEGTLAERGGTKVFVSPDFIAHPRTEIPSGGFAVAWDEDALADGTRRLFIAVGSTPINRSQWNENDSGVSAESEAFDELKRLRDGSFEEIVEDHRRWWHDYYRKSFFSISNRELESHYWVQLHKFASSSRPDRPFIDNHGVWSLEPVYGFSTWDYNVQSTYRLNTVANHLDFSRPLINFMRKNFNRETMWNEAHGELRAGMRQQVFLRYRFFDPEGWEHPENMPCDGPGKYLWGCHNVWLHYLYTLDEELLPALLDMLEGGINAMRAGMVERNGKLHIPFGRSWEAWAGENPTGLLSVFNWACETAAGIGRQIDAPEEKIAKWELSREQVVDYPTGPHGFNLGEGREPMTHRHWTQLMMINPLDIWDLDDPEKRSLAEKSVDYWATLSAGLGELKHEAFAPVAAIQLYAWLGKTEPIPKLIDNFLYRQGLRMPGVWPNTLYRESGPVIETPLFFANAIQECCLQTRRDGVHVFPAVPENWGEVIFRDWRAGGDVLVSGKWRDAAVEWVAVHALSAGIKVLRVNVDPAALKGLDERKIKVKNDGALEIVMGKNEQIILSPEENPSLEVAPVERRFGPKNPYGVNPRFYEKRRGCPPFSATCVFPPEIMGV